MNHEVAIRAEGLTRYFGNRVVVRELDFVVPRGSIVGLLGLNGAGKSTTIRMMLGFLTPTRGRCTILGCDSERLTPSDRVRIGHTVEGHFLYSWMRVAECEAFGRGTFSHWNRETFFNTIERFGIQKTQRVAWLSRGQKAGVSIASTLATNPELLILDDPALGLDPVSRRAFNETLIDFCADGERTVLLSSHLLDDIERVADRVAIMVDGRLLVDAPLDRFLARVSAWSMDSELTAGQKSSIPKLVHARRLAGQSIVAVVDADLETERAMSNIDRSLKQEPEMTFEDAILAFLSRQRSDSTYLSKRGISA